MIQLLHTLYITEPDTELRLKGEALRVIHKDGREDHVPIHLLDGIVTFSYGTVTQHVMAACAVRQIPISFLSQKGRFRFRVQGETRGNVFLRQKQYLLAEQKRIHIAAAMLRGKLENEALLLGRARINHPEHGGGRLQAAEQSIRAQAAEISSEMSGDELRGIEGQAAKTYFDVFSEMILSPDETFRFKGRSRRPPLDPCNAMLSFAYSMLTADCIAAIESVGLDPCVGLLHGIRPGKPSLALDLMEEFRPVMADRLVLHLINLRMVTAEMFQPQETGGIYLNQAGKKVFLQEWSRAKKREIQVPELEKSIPIGLLPHLQVQRLARCIRGEEDVFRTIEWR